MQKICAIILLTTLASNYEALPQTKWNRPIRNSQGQLIRERRQFPFGEWIPLSQPCPTCRPFADPLDVGLRGENIGLTPPRPPTVTRQIHGEGNFFPQDESSILSVPPPPPSAIPRHPIPNRNGNFQFSTFGQQFNNPIPLPTQQIQFLPQTFLQNQPLLVNGNQQSTFFGQDQNQQNINNGKINSFNTEFKTQKLPENVVLEQNNAPKQAFSNKPQPFAPSQQNQQQAFVQQQHSVNFGNAILTPPPAPKNVSQDIVIPGLDKEEIQLLYVPVETLRQRGTAQEQLLTQQQPQNIQFFNRGNGLQRPVNNVRPTEQTLVTQPKGHFVTQNGNGQGQTTSTLKVTSSQTFPTTVTPPTFFLQQLPFQQTPQPFVSATPATPTIQPFVTPSSVFGKFSSFTPDTTFSHLSTVPNNIQFSQSDLEFGTTPKTIINQEIINGKSQFSGLKSIGQEQARPFPQPFAPQQQVVTQQPQLSTVFSQEQQKELITPTHFPINQQQIALQKQQEHQRLLQQQRQKELEEQRVLEQQRKQKELEEQRQKELEQQRYLQKQKELEEQRQKELEQQRYLQKQKELEEQRQKELEHQRYLQKQKELEEQQRYLQTQKELEEQRLLQQQQRQKELEQQRFLQKQKELEEQRLLQQRQKEIQEQRFLQEQRQRELENQKRLQVQKQLEDKRRLQLKQKEEEQRLFRFQQQQKELEQQRLLQQQQEEQQRILQQQKLAKQKQENLKKQQQFQLVQQQQQQQQQQLQQKQQQKQSFPQQVFQQQNRHVLPANDNLNFIPQLEKESEPEDQQLVPHQPPLSVFFKGFNGAESRITDVLRELRSSNTITVLDQYFEKMPKVFVGPAGLIPPAGYQKFELPYLSNLESNRIERRIGNLPFFVAPLNFVPPPGYAKIPFPAPHIGSVVVSSESNPAMAGKTTEKGSVEEENVSGSFPVVGPELPGLINNLNTETTTVKPTTYVSSTPSLPQTTAQLRNRRPNNSLYKPQNRKPITRTRPTTTSKPEEDVTQPIQKVEITKDTEGGIKKPFNRFLNRRRPVKTTTESSLKSQQDGKSLENRHYSVEVYHQEKNQFPRTQQKSDLIQDKQNENEYNRQVEHASSIDRITPNGHRVFEVSPTPEFSQAHQTELRRPEEYADVNLQTFEDGPLPTGSAKTITQELYRPNIVNQQEEAKMISKPDSTPGSGKFQVYDEVNPTRFSEASGSPPTGVPVNVEPTSAIGYEKQDVSSERFDSTEGSRERVSFTPGSESAEEHQTKGYLDSNEQYTSAFAEISKPHHIPGFVDSTQRQQLYPTPEIAADLQAPYSQKQSSQEYDVYGEVKPTQYSGENVSPTGSSNEHHFTGFEGDNQQSVGVSQVSPTAPGATEEQYPTGFSVNAQPQNSAEANRQSEDERIGSFISVQDVHSTASPQQYYHSSTTADEYPVHVEQNQPPSGAPEVTVNPSVQTYTSGLEGVVKVHEQTQTTEGHGVANNFPTDHRLKLPDPSIVRVRTRTRGKSRGQVNFAASQTTTAVPFTRSKLESTHSENTEEHTTKGNNFRDYNPVKTSKYNQFRGVKKPVRTTTEATIEEKANVYTIRPQRRPLNPSTVSTKRIRRPTTPLPSVDTGTEAYGISAGSYPQSEHTDISPSGVSNDVYYEQSSLSPVKHKFRKHFGSAEQKNDVVPAYLSTSHPSIAPTYTAYAQEGYSEEYSGVRDVTQTEAPQEKYPEWNPSESGFDVSGIVLTTAPTPEQEDVPEEEPKKSQDSKKAFDPDLEKKTGRRRVRVRVHKRPHENFETAESQNLRTVANVLVPPTTTYKPNDESSIHQLAKNSDFTFGGQKLFGSRSREYFRKRLNLTDSDGASKDGEQAINVQGGDVTEKPTELKFSGFVKKTEKTEIGSTHANENSEGTKVVRPKFRGFVRKIIKHGGASKEVESKPETEGNEGKHENNEYNVRQLFRTNHTDRTNGTRHKTFVRYVKKNKIRHHDTEFVQESQESQKEDQGIHQTTESHTQPPAPQETSEFNDVKEEKVESQSAVNSAHQQAENVELQQPETTEEPEIRQTQPLIQATQTVETETASQTQESSTSQPATPLTHVSGLYLTQRNKFYQTLRPVFQRTTPSEFQRTREPESTTKHSTTEPQEKRSGFSRFKYGKTTGYGPISSEKSDEIKKVNEQEVKNKNLHTLEVRKYLRTKTREGAFSQFSKNKYYTSEKTESKDQESVEEVITTEKATKASSINPETTQAVIGRTDSVEVENETTENEESEHQEPTTESIISSEEESSEEDDTSSANLGTTTEADILTTVFLATESETPGKIIETKSQTTESIEPQRTEYQPDIYRFSKNSFSFDETEKFTGTKNRAHVRNITTDIIENTASFSAPGVEKRPEIRVVTHRSDEQYPVATESHSETTQKEKTEGETTESSKVETTTDYPETETTVSTDAVTKDKVAKVLKTSTTTKISHETEICYRGKCIRTKSENSDDDLKKLVDSASTMKIEKTKT